VRFSLGSAWPRVCPYQRGSVPPERRCVWLAGCLDCNECFAQGVGYSRYAQRTAANSYWQPWLRCCCAAMQDSRRRQAIRRWVAGLRVPCHLPLLYMSAIAQSWCCRMTVPCWRQRYRSVATYHMHQLYLCDHAHAWRRAGAAVTASADDGGLDGRRHCAPASSRWLDALF
jgi:hypothetical protein